MNYTHILYHRECPDGFGAAWAAWKVLGGRATYIPVAYQEPLPALPMEAQVLMVDFCPKPEALSDLASRVLSVEILDHHKSALDAMKGFARPNVRVTFDMEHSGAYLSWMHFHGVAAPLFVLYLEDRDMWRFKLEGSKEALAALSSYPMKFEVWDHLFMEGIYALKLEGKAILRYQEQRIEEMCARMFWKEFDGHRVPCANATVLFSEVGNRLCEMHPEVPFAAYYHDVAEGKRKWGLRSPGRFDVTEIAKRRGGGGHPGAAGFMEDLKA